jgi:uncharacterized protein (DUF736 family)
MATQPQTNNKPKKEDEIGAFWRKTKQDGGDYYTGYFQTKGGERVNVVIFPNSFKQEGEMTPDLRVYESKPLTQGASRPAANPAPRQAKPASAPMTSVIDDAVDVGGDDIPF